MLKYLIVYIVLYLIFIIWHIFKNKETFKSNKGFCSNIENFWSNSNQKLLWILSFTLLSADICKFKKEGNDKANLIEKFNSRYLLITFVISFFLVFSGMPNNKLMLCIYEHKELFYIEKISELILIAFGFYAFSRVNEIFIAFIRDAQDQLSKAYNKNGLKYYRKIVLAMKSYIELILLYGILQFLLSFGVFDDLLNNFMPLAELSERQLHSKPDNIANIVWDTAWDAIYFSGITIATIGYGDLTPKSGVSQFLAIYEVINGITLLVVSFTVYVSRSIDEKECNKDKDYSSNNAIKGLDKNLQKCREVFEEIEQQEAIIKEQREKQKECLKEAINNLQSALENFEQHDKRCS